jgi:hypothetical protein
MGLFNRKKKNEKANKAPAGNDAELMAVLSAAVAAASSDEHIAVIAAALAAYEDGGAQTDLRISRIDRAAGTIPAWGVMGNREQIDTRRM